MLPRQEAVRMWNAFWGATLFSLLLRASVAIACWLVDAAIVKFVPTPRPMWAIAGERIVVIALLVVVAIVGVSIIIHLSVQLREIGREFKQLLAMDREVKTRGRHGPRR